MTDTARLGHDETTDASFLEICALDEEESRMHRAFLGVVSVDPANGALRIFRRGDRVADVQAYRVDGQAAGQIMLYGPRGGRTLQRNVTLATDSDENGGYLELRGSHRTVRIDQNGVQVSPNKVLFGRAEDPPPTFTWDFVAEHPEDPTKEIHYCVLEGPEVGVFVRGTARLDEGKARVMLPEHFGHVASPSGLTVSLTPRSADSLGVAATTLSCRDLVIQELARGHGNYDVDN